MMTEHELIIRELSETVRCLRKLAVELILKNQQLREQQQGIEQIAARSR
jgi:hypothetical protein